MGLRKLERAIDELPDRPWTMSDARGLLAALGPKIGTRERTRLGQLLGET
jgi:hypothetical protein